MSNGLREQQKPKRCEYERCERFVDERGTNFCFWHLPLKNKSLDDIAHESIPSNLQGAYLIEADLAGEDLSDVILSESDMKEATLKDANLSGAKLSDANLRNAVLRGTNLKNSDLTGANLQGADLSYALIQDAILSGVKPSAAETIFNRVGSLSGVNLTGIDVSGEDLSEVDFVGANLTDADFSKAVLIGTRFSEATLKRAIFRHADLSRADFSDANLSYANFRDTDLSNVTLDGADLSKSDYVGLIQSALTSKDRMTRAAGIESAAVLARTHPDRCKELIEPLLEGLRDISVSPIQSIILEIIHEIDIEATELAGSIDETLASLLREESNQTRETIATKGFVLVERHPKYYPKTVQAYQQALDSDTDTIRNAAIQAVAVVAYDAPELVIEQDEIIARLQGLRNREGTPIELVEQAIQILSAESGELQ